LRVQILLYEEEDAEKFYIVDLQHQLLQVGHIAGFAPKSMRELGMDTKRIIRFVEKTEADAWVVFSGSRELLEWFSQQRKPALALAGRRREIPIASSGPDKAPAMRAALRRLVSLGHRRIVMLSREIRRKPSPGLFEREFLKELAAQGILTGSYNLPDWKDNMEDFHRCLDSLFRHTPPTALVIVEMPLLIAAQQHLAQRGILAPRDVSLVCDDPDPAFSWCKPSVAHIHWDPSPVIRRIIRWADNVARGKDDRRHSFSKSKFVDGETIGPAQES
jgi:DNA-binding LacI/PurR family transcriptional regulator